MSRRLLYPLVFIFYAGCAGQQGPGEPGGTQTRPKSAAPAKAPSEGSPDDTPGLQPQVEQPRMAHGPDGEMIPSLFKKGEGIVPSDSGSKLPKERLGLMKAARDALAGGRIDEAVAIADTLVILHPQDPEIYQLRASVLASKGDGEQAELDLAKCCELGRKNCCRDRDTDRDASD